MYAIRSYYANTFGEQKTLVMLVNFQDAPGNQPWTLEQANSLRNNFV